MTYFKEANPETDSLGTIIKHGDILKNTDPSTWGCNHGLEYFIAFKWGPFDDQIEIRDLDNNNVGMCYTGLDGDLINLGHWSYHLDKLSDEDLTYHFGWELPVVIRLNGAKVDPQRNEPLKQREEEFKE